jgi:hypothetical protein
LKFDNKKEIEHEVTKATMMKEQKLKAITHSAITILK